MDRFGSIDYAVVVERRNMENGSGKVLVWLERVIVLYS